MFVIYDFNQKNLTVLLCCFPNIVLLQENNNLKNDLNRMRIKINGS